MKPENRSFYVGIGKRINLVMIFFALVAISCGGGGGGGGAPGNDSPGGNPTINSPVSMSEAMSLACNNNQINHLADNLSWEVTADEVKCVYITSDGSGDTNGGNWDNAFSVGKLRALSTDGDNAPTRNQVFLYLLKAGTYTPIDGDDRTKSFTMRNRVAIIGGFSGNDFERLGTTILSGDLDGDNDISDNSHHVIINNSNGVNSSALLAHVTVSHGNGDSSNFGGGMYNVSVSPTLTAVTFSGNSAIIGGGMYNNSASPTLTAVTFSGNTADSHGGGMYSEVNSSLNITESTFSNNTAAEKGGGMFINRSSMTVTATTFSGNRATEGGGIYNLISSSTVTASTFNLNEATANGGAFYIDNDRDGALTLVNSLLWGNKAVESGSQVTNQVYLNTDGSGNEVLIVRHSVLEGDVEGVTNADTVAERKIFEERIEVNDPFLTDLADNGGPVRTHAIPADSSAENMGVKTGWTTDRKLCFREGSGNWLRADDQKDTADSICTGDITEITTDARGYTHNGLPDIGAYEVNGTPPPNP